MLRLLWRYRKVWKEGTVIYFYVGKMRKEYKYLNMDSWLPAEIRTLDHQTHQFYITAKNCWNTYFRFFTRNISWAMEILLYYGVESFRLVFVSKFDIGKRVERMRKKDVNTLQCAVAKYLNVTEKIRIRKDVDGFQWISAVKFVYGDIKPHAKVRRTYMKMEAKLLYWPFFIVLLLCKGAAE